LGHGKSIIQVHFAGAWDMTDKQHIEEAYAQILRELFRTFFERLTAAKGNKESEAQAEEAFARGVTHARYVRERVIGALP
jgi:2-keto-3-deoxy-galactonokinase